MYLLPISKSEKQIQLEKQGCVFNCQERLDLHELDTKKNCFCGRPNKHLTHSYPACGIGKGIREMIDKNETDTTKEKDSASKSELGDLLCTWKKIAEEKPKQNQICIVAANIGICSESQYVAVKWVKHKFVWAIDIGLGDFPSEYTTHWMPWPSDPVT